MRQPRRRRKFNRKPLRVDDLFFSLFFLIEKKRREENDQRQQKEREKKRMRERAKRKREKGENRQGQKLFQYFFRFISFSKRMQTVLKKKKISFFSFSLHFQTNHSHSSFSPSLLSLIYLSSRRSVGFKTSKKEERRLVSTILIFPLSSSI